MSVSDDARLRISALKTSEPHIPPQTLPSRIFSVAVSHDAKLIMCGGDNGRVHVWRLDMAVAGLAMWPVSFVRNAHELEYCPLDDQGILANATVGDDGWLCGSKGGNVLDTSGLSARPFATGVRVL
jgi:hypothetical protein